jgi:hypothetical protein
MPKKKIIHVADVTCPHCMKTLAIWQETETLKPSVKAERTVTYRVEKGKQSTL